MISILSPTSADVIAQIARNRTLLAFDFDGTLAPIAGPRKVAAPHATPDGRAEP